MQAWPSSKPPPLRPFPSVVRGVLCRSGALPPAARPGNFAMGPPDAFGFEEAAAAAAAAAPAPPSDAPARRKRSVLDAAAARAASGQPLKRPRRALSVTAAPEARPEASPVPPPASGNPVPSCGLGKCTDRGEHEVKKILAPPQGPHLAPESAVQQSVQPRCENPSESVALVQSQVQSRQLEACEQPPTSPLRQAVTRKAGQDQTQSSTPLSELPVTACFLEQEPKEVVKSKSVLNPGVADRSPSELVAEQVSPVVELDGAGVVDLADVAEVEPSVQVQGRVSPSLAPSALRRCDRERLPPTRRVRFDPALPEAPFERVPILRAVYSSRRGDKMLPTAGAQRDTSRRRRSMRALPHRPSSRAAAATAAAAPIDVTDAVGGARTADERALADQLQYLLDGVVKGGRAEGGRTDDLLFGSLAELADLFLSMAPPPPQQRSEAAADAAAATTAVADAKNASECAKAQTRATAAAVALEATNCQPSMLKRIGGAVLETVVSRLLVLRSRTVPVSLLVGSIMLILARSDATDQLFRKPQIAALVDAFYQVAPVLVAGSTAVEADDCAVASDKKAGGDKKVALRSASLGVRKRRRGRLARRVATCSAEGEGGVILRVRSLLRDGCGLEESITNKVEENAIGVAMVYGLALAGALEASSNARAVMLESHRVHRIVAVLSEAERRSRAAESTDAVVASSRAITAVSLRVLEYATLHHRCQDVITRESKVVQTAVSVLRLGGHSVRTSDGIDCDPLRVQIHPNPVPRSEPNKGAFASSNSLADPPVPLYDELVLADALRLCVNLTHDCNAGLAQFIAAGGVGVVLDLIASPAVWPRPGLPVVEKNPLRETFDVRVLSVALLASVVTQNKNIGAFFQDIHPRGVVERDGGAVAFVLELLKSVGDSQPASSVTNMNPGDPSEAGGTPVDEGGDAGSSGLTVADNSSPVNGTSASSVRLADDASHPQSCGNGNIGMDQRVTTGYLCLLLGALVAGSSANRSLVVSAMPKNSLAPIADVLAEFLTFHHELGVVSTSVDEMYAGIIESLRDGSLAAETVSGSKDEAIDLTVDQEPRLRDAPEV